MSHTKHLIAALITSMLVASAAWTQVDLGTITGIVTDPTGAVVPGVAITITNSATGVTNSVTTNASGVYTVPLLLPSSYTLVAVKEKFKKFTQSDILVQLGATVRADVTLTLGSKTENVQVTGTALTLERETSDTQTTITGKEVEGLPLTSYGAPMTPANFMQLAPGVTGKGASQFGDGAPRTMSTMVSGSMVSSTTMILDGADIPTLNEFEGDLQSFQIPPDAIGEFKLEANNADAAFGRSGGGAASFQVKSGTNEMHGSAYEFVRNDALNAMNFFLNAYPANCTSNGRPKACRPPFKQNEFGATAGGPIRKDKAFVFGWYDGYRFTQGVGTGFASLPTDEMKQGNFTNYGTYDVGGNWTMTPIVDPITKTLCGDVVCNNVINPLYFDRVSKLLLPFFPTALGGPRAVTSNYINTQAKSRVGK